MRRGVTVVLLLLSASVSLQGKDLDKPPQTGFPVVEFYQGQSIYDLPGYEALMPLEPRQAINITLTPATVQASKLYDLGPFGEPLLLSFTNGVYREDVSVTVHAKQHALPSHLRKAYLRRDDDTGEVSLFGPTLRLKAGDTYAIRLTNNMTASGPKSSRENFFHDLQYTNLHTHGLHGWPGVDSQASARDYQGGDNIFTRLPPKATPDAEPASMLVSGIVPLGHLPGLHWYHPHKHGAAALQTFTASGLILVEDDPAWLPDKNGCATVRSLLGEAPDLLLHLELLTFSQANLLYQQLQGDYFSKLEDASPQTISELADPENNLCCDSPGQNVSSLPVLGSANSSDIILVNGGYQPIVPLESGQYQRWRLVNTGFRRFLDLQILDAETSKPAKECELLLIAKDGVYLMEIPREVDHIFLSNGNRAELLVRCTAPAGKRYVLAAGAAPSQFGALFGTSFGGAESLAQPVVLTMEIEAAQGSDQPTPDLRGCTPLRPTYAPDLRDEALQAHNAMALLVNHSLAFTFEQGFGCLVNGKNFSLPDPAPVDLPIGKVVHVQFDGINVHPFHIHVNPYQLVKLYPDQLDPGANFTSWFEEGDWMDVIQLPMLSLLAPASIGLRVQPGPFAGYAVMHCHRLAHEDEGCMKVVKYACPGYDEKQPERCSSYQPPVPGTFTV
ncbi:hypothetical protein N2152v2_003445 [Parachlorella kessleri]